MNECIRKSNIEGRRKVKLLLMPRMLYPTGERNGIGLENNEDRVSWRLNGMRGESEALT